METSIITQVHNISSEDFKKEIVEDVTTHISVVLKEIMSEIQRKATTPEYLTSKEACKILKITLPTLYEWRKKGIVKAYRIANKIRYKKSEIEDSLKKIDVNHKNCQL